MVTTFQRARSDEQRAIRRQAILETAAVMLTEMPVAQVSLNELSRRVGLAKSNVLRYFESREAVLLELLDDAWSGWLTGLAGDMHSAVDSVDPVARRVDQVAATLASSLGRHPVLCDLLSAQAAVLERNVSAGVAARYKRAAIANVGALSLIVLEHIVELGEQNAGRFAAAAVLVAGAVWTHAQPSAAMMAVYESEPDLAAMRLDATPTMRDLFEVLISGLLARAAG